MSSPSADPPWTVERLLAWTRDFLQRRGLESPRLCAEILLADALGCERLRLFTQYEQTPPPEKLEQFRAAVKSAAAGRPIAYIVGRKDFFALTFEVSPAVLIPRPETELLVERVIALVRSGAIAPDARVLDLGTGSGCIPIALAKNLPALRIAAGDLSAPALDVARKNAARHGVSERIDFREGDLFAPWQPPGDIQAADPTAAAAPTNDPPEPFAVIVSNPPYIAADRPDEVAPHVREFEPGIALFGGGDGLRIIHRLIADAPRHISDAGHLLFEVAAGQAAAARDLLHVGGWQALQIYKDHAGHERVLHARRPARP